MDGTIHWRSCVDHVHTCTYTAAAGVSTPDTACTEGRRPAASCSRSTWGLAAKLSWPPTLKTCLRGPIETAPLSHSPAWHHTESLTMHCSGVIRTDDVSCFTRHTVLMLQRKLQGVVVSMVGLQPSSSLIESKQVLKLYSKKLK